MVLRCWMARLPVLQTDDAIAGWMLCVMPEVRQDVAERRTGAHRDAVNRVVRRMHKVPNPNKSVLDMEEDDIVQLFWTEYKLFERKLQHYAESWRWKSNWVRQGKSHLWHEQHSLEYTKVLGFVACRRTSDGTGIGEAERAWGAVKEIKSGKRSHMGGPTTEKRAIVFSTARVAEAKIRQQAMERIDAEGEYAMFCDDDIK